MQSAGGKVHDRRFVGDRLFVARTFCRFTQQELAERIGWSAARVSLAERDKATPQGIVLEAIAEMTGFAPSFFSAPIPEVLSEDRCSFRRLRSASKRDREGILARGTLLVTLLEHLRARLELPEIDVPQAVPHGEQGIDDVAMQVREHWALGDAPIGYVGRVLERAGVPWVLANADAERIDAFSYAGQEINVVFVNDERGQASRMVFNLAHELGHLVMHRESSLEIAEREAQANRFAGAFLMPRSSFAREFPRRVDWARLLEMKRTWKVSLAAMVRRAYDLRLIGAAEYQQAFKALSARGWRKGEPGEPKQEEPELVRIGLETLSSELGEGPDDVADALGWTAEVFEKVTGIVATPTANDQVTDIQELYRKGKESQMSKKKDYHVTPHPEGGWQVKREGGDRATSRHGTQGEAVADAREHARREKVEVVIHRPNGQIRDSDSYGPDPNPPRDTKH